MTKILQVSLLICFSLNFLAIGEVMPVDRGDVFSAALHNQASVLSCTSMSSLVMKIMKNVYAQSSGIAVACRDRFPVKDTKKAHGNSSANKLFLVPNFSKLDRCLCVSKVLSNIANVVKHFEYDQAAVSKIKMIFGVHIIVMLSVFQFFMLPRGSIDGSYSIVLRGNA
jgi:hypothetical protein